ncbi:hypothetical protein A2U01_0026922 [Trifolium medium]|uniref:Uncharacterized protein n=1 Tax=Trifolium medium TaxID=97028 RepID=A0A392P1H9_9FABA|nr:hypothetical protein [Trifolium medium]
MSQLVSELQWFTSPAPPSSEAPTRPRWVRRSVSAVRDFPPGCGPSVTPTPPTTAAPDHPAFVPYHVYHAMVLDRDYLYARNVELARLLDQSVASSSFAHGAPSEDLRC